MAYLVFIFASLALLVGFFALINYEARRGSRLYEPQRAKLDRTVERIVFITEHVNLAEFLRDEVRHLAGKMGHDIAHFSLIVVRAIERILTSLVRRLRNHPEIDTAQRETAREFVKTLSDFKDGLNAKHPEIQEIQK
ncbi:MAG: hypothetical protein AAB555_00190 [Patescibacteria group bacterium]